MFARLTDRARKVVSTAQGIAERLRHPLVGTELILLSLVKETTGTAVLVLKNLAVDVDKVRRDLEKRAQPQVDPIPLDKITFAYDTKKALEYATDEATLMGHKVVGTEHLLLGLIRENNGLAAQILKKTNLTLDEVRDEVLEVVSSKKLPKNRIFPKEIQSEQTFASDEEGETTREYAPVAVGAGPFERFTERAQKVLNLAAREADRMNDDYVGTEHILLGIIKEGSGVAVAVLRQKGIYLDSIGVYIEKLAEPKPDATSPKAKLPLTTRSKKVLKAAGEESRAMKHDCIGTEHLLLGVLHERAGLGAQVLLHMGWTLEGVRAEIVEFYRTQPAKVKRFTVNLTKTNVDFHVQQAIKAAFDEALALGVDCVQSEHLLLGLLKVPEGMAAKVLKKHSLELEALRKEILKLREESGGSN